MAVSCEFAFTGGEQTFTVPPDVSQIAISAVGGTGATTPIGSPDGTSRFSEGGSPDKVHAASIFVTPGETLYVEVGGDGDWQTPNDGGWNGGGDGGLTPDSPPGWDQPVYGGGGGGATDVQTRPCGASDDCLSGLSPNDFLVVAAGGGGAGYQGSEDAAGGSGGAPGVDGGTGADDGRDGPSAGGGRASTQAGGDGGAGSVASLTGVAGGDGADGVLGAGGTGGATAGLGGGGGGGGGGLYGGGGGAGGAHRSFGETVGSGGGGGGGGSSVFASGTSGDVSVDTAGDDASVTITYSIAQADVHMSCPRASMPVGQSETCSVVVSSKATVPMPTSPVGTVTVQLFNYTDPTGTGTLDDGGICTLTRETDTAGASSCAFTYTPTVAGTATLTASYSGDDNYQSGTSFDGSASATGVLTTSSAITCSPQSLSGVAATGDCTVTVTNTTGTLAPTGSIYLDGAISAPPIPMCTLAPVDEMSSSCTIEYTPNSSGLNSYQSSYGGDFYHSGSNSQSASVMVGGPPTMVGGGPPLIFPVSPSAFFHTGTTSTSMPTTATAAAAAPCRITAGAAAAFSDVAQVMTSVGRKDRRSVEVSCHIRGSVRRLTLVLSNGHRRLAVKAINLKAARTVTTSLRARRELAPGIYTVTLSLTAMAGRTVVQRHTLKLR